MKSTEQERLHTSSQVFRGDAGTIRSSNNLHPVVVGTGLVSLDVVFVDENGTEPKYWAGGTCGNVLAILAYLGWQAYPVGILGQDEAGSLLVRDIKRFGVHTRLLQRDDKRHTPIVVEHIGRTSKGIARHRFSWVCPNCGAQLPRYNTVPINRARHLLKKLPNLAVFFFDRISRGVLHIAEACAARGALVVFEPSSVKEARLFQEAVSISHIVKYSHQRMRHLRLPSYPPPLLEIETLGDAGLRYRFKGKSSNTSLQWSDMQAYTVNSVTDTTGAGDWCTAGILHLLGKNGAQGFSDTAEDDVIEALQFGQALAAFKCGYEGARGVMYTISRKKLEREVERIRTYEQPLTTRESPETEFSEVLRHICPRCIENHSSVIV